MAPPAAPAGQFRTRLKVLFAAAAPKAVILRRGPRTYWRLITWDLRRDVFTPGQWMRGLIRLCDLSPSGNKLIYWAAQHHTSAPWRISRKPPPGRPYDALTALAAKPPRPGRRIPRYMRGSYQQPQARPARMEGTWTAVSTPPYFTALALWPAFGHWTGGGLFQDDRSILVQEPESRMVPIENVPIPRAMRIGCWFGSGHGLNPSAHGPSEGAKLASGPFWQALTEAGASWIEWVHVDPPDDLLFACDGCIYRLPNWRNVDATDYLRTAKRIADFRDMHFEAVQAPPEAMQW
jgi:hypothetical protein